MARSRKSRKRLIIIWTVIGAVIVLGVAGGLTWFLLRPSASVAAPVTIQVRTMTLTQSISSTGTIAPSQQSNLNFTVAGQVTAVNVSAGQAVVSGQTLATVNSANLASNLASAQSSAASAQARLTADTNASASDAQLNADQAALTAAQNAVTTAQSNLSAANLTAPFSGVVASVNLTVGQQVSGSGSSGSGSGSGTSSTSSTQIVLITSNAFIVNATVDDTQVGSVKTGQAVAITANGQTTPVTGSVQSVGLIPSGTSVPTYPVVVGVTGPSTTLHPGASATVSITINQVPNALVVPASAIHYTNGGSSVLKVVDGATQTVPVKTGLVSGGEVQITSGLASGDEVQLPAGTVGGRQGGGTSRTGGGAGGFGGGGAGGFGGGGGFGGNRNGG